MKPARDDPSSSSPAGGRYESLVKIAAWNDQGAHFQKLAGVESVIEDASGNRLLRAAFAARMSLPLVRVNTTVNRIHIDRPHSFLRFRVRPPSDPGVAA